ncbi:hypothetical protein IKG28_02240 [Candidatus Saccharibacteria bacterium]|nr:hypothetical protein [Candidatus Saccharibacteria bacterium]
MSAEDVLRESEDNALDNKEIISSVVGKTAKLQLMSKKGSFSAAIFLTLAIGIIAILFGSGNLIPSAISERLIEETDVQYADAVKSKMIIFQQALMNNEIPEDTARKLNEGGVEVGHFESNDTLSLKYNGKIISASNFVREASTNANLYKVFSDATYGRAAYYYDETALKVFKRIGTSRNNYTADSDFDETMKRLVGEGSSISVNGASLVQKSKEEGGKVKIYYDYETTSPDAKSSGTDASGFINAVREKSGADNQNAALSNLTETLNIADNVSKEQKSSLFFLAFMENVSKMKAGQGSESKINEAMSFLTKETDTEVVDVETGEKIILHGSALNSPSLYAILTGEPLKSEVVNNFASDRIINTIENQANIDIDDSFLKNTTVSTSNNVRGTIGRYTNGNVMATSESVGSVTATIDKSLINNSFDSINGIYAGEFLVEGAVNVGKELAKASGATAGSAEAVKSYARLSSNILAIEAEVDRLNRSPFDVTSKNTFLGSILYNFAISIGTTNMSSMLRTAIMGLTPVTKAADETERYLAVQGNNCKTLNSIGAVGTASCVESATFDTSTLDNIFSDAGFIEFVNNNTTLNNGVREVKKNSKLAKFIAFSVGRISPIGVMDGGILSSIASGLENIPFVSDIAAMVRNLSNADEETKRLATGAAFVNSSDNNDWQTYKYAQRYVSLARATESLKQFTSDKTAYNNIPFFEGDSNPVVAFLDNYYQLANK